MRLLKDWQYKYIEKSLFNYYKLPNSKLETETKMCLAIKEAYNFFEGTQHRIMMEEYYFKRDDYKRKYSSSGHFHHVCWDLIHTEEPNGYVIRREIIYRVAMNCYELRIFRTNLSSNY